MLAIISITGHVKAVSVICVVSTITAYTQKLVWWGKNITNMAKLLLKDVRR